MQPDSVDAAVYVLGGAVVLAWVFAVGMAVGGLLAWTLITFRLLSRRVDELERLVRSPHLLVDLARMEERTGLLSALALWELSIGDSLDGLQRVAPERAARAVKKARRK
jgi:hypothetical protein